MNASATHNFDLTDIVVSIVAIGGAFGIPIIAIVMYWWYQIRKVICDAALKQAMVERGYSANEIVHVITSGTGKLNNPAFDLPPAKSLKPAAVGA
ncbi:MAG: hypothetical protein K8R36_16915 [Planctomycetales bacterium]|nr:hypothetical protein [Planctomycetales bacterium]